MLKYFIQAGTGPAGVIPASLPYVAIHFDGNFPDSKIQKSIFVHLPFIQGKNHKHQA